MKRVAVVGAGAIGIWIAAKLAAAGNEVGLLARGRTGQAIGEKGILLREEGLEVRPPVEHLDEASASPRDLLVLAVKSPSLQDAAAAARPLIGPGTLIVPMLNGVPWWFLAGSSGLDLASLDPDGVLARTLPIEQIVGCVVYAACSSPEPGVSVRAAGNRLVLGERGGAIGERLHGLGALFEQAGLEVTLTDSIRKEIWYKLWGNLSVNPISALTGATGDRILGDELIEAFILRLMEEAREIGAGIGCPIPQSAPERIAATRRLGAFKTSMLQDAEAGRQIELDALLAAPREIAAQLGIATPNMDALFGLTRLFARTKGLYPAK